MIKVKMFFTEHPLAAVAVLEYHLRDAGLILLIFSIVSGQCKDLSRVHLLFRKNSKLKVAALAIVQLPADPYRKRSRSPQKLGF